MMEVLVYNQPKALSVPGSWSSVSEVLNNNAGGENVAVKRMNSVQELRYTYEHQNHQPPNGIRNSAAFFIQPPHNPIGQAKHFKTAATTYDFPDHSTDFCPSPTVPSKKVNIGSDHKKWSLGNLFRRRKKDESDCSSNEETKQQRKEKKKSEKKQRTKRSYFDHIVIPPPNQKPLRIEQNSYLTNRPLPKVPKELNSGQSKSSGTSVDGLPRSPSNGRKSRKELTKQRAVARRDSLARGDSSDEDSQKSQSFKSDESLSSRIRDRSDSSVGKRSRSARTERYIRRLSKDEESILNREALQRQARDNWQMKLTHYNDYKGFGGKTENADTMLSPTMPPNPFDSYHRPTYVEHNRDEVDNAPLHKDKSATCFNLRSWSCENNMHEMPSPEVVRRNRSIKSSASFSETPGNSYRNILRYKHPPPPPPPRDPKRISEFQHFNGNGHSYFIPQEHRYFYNNGYHRTVSEDQINQNGRADLFTRPASAMQESRQGQWGHHRLTAQRSQPENYKYLTEKKARSRKPIFIQSTDKINMENYKESAKAETSGALWASSKLVSAPPASPTQMFTAQTTNVTSKVFLPNGDNNEIDSRSYENQSSLVNSSNFENCSHYENASFECESYIPLSTNKPERNSSPFKPIVNAVHEDQHHRQVNSSEQEEDKRKSANLEEALDELEAIYKSLHLGDDDLLERAEEREISLATKKMIEKSSETYPQPASLLDSSFNFEPYTSGKTNNLAKRPRTLDRICDDMAFRKLNKNTNSANINLKNSPVNNISYLLASPVHSHSPDDLEVESLTIKEEMFDGKEPDITLDDVVFRTIRHCNNTLKVTDPQPPFGIPIGPVTQAPASDYLHALPSTDNSAALGLRSRTPDVVKDDLAFRNLRKDSNKEPALKRAASEGSSRHNRAVRSLSANISNILRPQLLSHDEDVENEFNTTSLSDIADAMEIARQILKEKENRIISTKRAFLSDSDTKYYGSKFQIAETKKDLEENRQHFLNNMRSTIDANNIYMMTKPPASPSQGRTPENNALALCDKESNKINEKHVLSGPQYQQLDQIENVSKEAQITCEKLVDCVKDTTELVASTKTAESYPLEEVEDRLEPILPPLESVANVVTTCLEEDEEEQEPYKKSPFEEHKAELIASFKELDMLVSDSNIGAGRSKEEGEASVNDELLDVVARSSPPANSSCANVSAIALPCTADNCCCIEPVCLGSTSSNSSHESAELSKSFAVPKELESPKLVTSVMKHKNARDSKEADTDLRTRRCLAVPSHAVASRKIGPSDNNSVGNSSSSNNDRSLKKTSTWYGDPLVLAFACSYGVACSYQVASLDIVTILGLLFVILSIVVALILDER